MKVLAKFLAIVAIFLGVVSTVTSCGYVFMHKSPEERAEWIVKNVSDDLKLNEAQVAKLNALKDDMMAMRKEYLQQRNDTRKAIGDLLTEPTLDQSRALALIKDRTQEVNDKAPQLVNAFAAFYDSLTPEQQKKLHDEVTERINRHRGYWDD